MGPTIDETITGFRPAVGGAAQRYRVTPDLAVYGGPRRGVVTFFRVTGAYVYVDPDGTAVGVEDVFTKPRSAREHYAAVGLGADFADQFVR